MRISHLTHKGVRDLNEDAILINDDYGVYGVFDGASSLTTYLSETGKTGAYLASNTVAETFKKPLASLQETAVLANKNIEQLHERSNVDVSDIVNRFGTTAAAIRVDGNYAEIIQVGDSIVLLIKKNGKVEIPLGYHDHDLDVMRKWREYADSGRKDIRKLVADDVIRLRRQANTSYGLLNGDNRASSFIQSAKIDLREVATIILLTDGMFIPKEDPEAEEDWNDYARLHRKGGLAHLYETVRKIEDSDQGLVKYPRYKLHDDASAIAIDL
jgi:serine/threonine protein phosphatase PrpC